MKLKSRQLFILTFPVVLAIGILLIPVVSNYDQHDLAAQAVNLTGRWFVGHLLSAVAFTLSLFSVSIINQTLQTKSRSISAPTFLLLAVGAGFYAAGLGADGIGPIAVQAAGLSPTVFFDGSGWWVIGTFITATIFFGVGLIFLVVTLIQYEVLQGIFRYIAFVSALIFMAAPAIPSGYALYGVAVAALGIFVPIAVSIE